MKSRCENQNSTGYSRYGGRGIQFRFGSVAECATYLMSLPGCALDLEVDRIDNDGNYEIGNLQWLTHKQQHKNRRTNRYVTYKDCQYVLQDFCRLFCVISVSQAAVLLSRGASAEDLIVWRHQYSRDCCSRGHPYTTENTYIRISNGSRVCKTCARLRASKRSVK